MLGVEGRALLVTKEIFFGRLGAVGVDVGLLGGPCGPLWPAGGAQAVGPRRVPRWRLRGTNACC